MDGGTTLRKSLLGEKEQSVKMPAGARGFMRGCPQRLASASFAPRTRAVCVGEGAEEAGTLLQKRPKITQDKEPLSFAFLFPCSPFLPPVCPCPLSLSTGTLPTASCFCGRGKGKEKMGIT